jgi:glycosyltransferase involved in cell wall biosynthesis
MLVTMKIGFFGVFRLNTKGTPGFEKWVISISNQLVKLGHVVYVFGLTSIPKRYFYEFDNKLPMKFNFSYFEIESKWGRLIPLHMKKIPDIDLDLIYVSAGYYSLVKQILMMRGKKVFGFHIPSIEHPSGMRSKALVKRLLPRFDGIHVLSKTQLSLLPNGTNILELPNTAFIDNIGSEISKFDDFTVVYFSRWELSKGVHTLAYVCNSIPDDVRIIILGFGSVDITQIIANRNNVEIKGIVDENSLYEIVKKSHVTLFPSFKESSSLTLLESIALGTPVVYRDIPQNSFLKVNNDSLNLQASSDEEFVSNVMKLKKLYEEDKESYFQRCSLLKSGVMSIEEYIKKLNSFLCNLL